MFVGIDQGIEGLSIDQSLFDEQRFKRLHAHRGVRRDRLSRVIMVLASSLGVDRGGRCPCGRHSGLQETASASVHRILKGSILLPERGSRAEYILGGL